MILTAAVPAIHAWPLPPAFAAGHGDGIDLSLLEGRRRADRLKIALLVPLSGPAGLWGPSCQTSALMAAREINAAGGILGREVELVFADAGGDQRTIADDTIADEPGELDVARELAAGTRFAGYEIEGVAGRGGMGIVYRARQVRPARIVALMSVIAFTESRVASWMPAIC